MSKHVGKFNGDAKRDIIHKLTDVISSDTRPFVNSIENIKRLRNEPVVLLADKKTMYILPVGTSDDRTS